MGQARGKRGTDAGRTEQRSGGVIAPVLALAALLIPGGALQAAPSREAAVNAKFATLRDQPGLLRMFLRQMPKGGDLHNHLGGGIYAEDFLAWAAGDGKCLAQGQIVAPPCQQGQALADIIEKSPELYGRTVDSLSTRGWQAGVDRDGVSGHDQFFATFERFAPASRGHAADALATARRMASDDRLSYLELDHTPEALIDWSLAAPAAPLDEAGLAARYAQEIAGIAPVLDRAVAEIDRDEAGALDRLGCAGARPEPACAVAVRYIGCAFRAMPPGAVFRTLIASFALAARDRRFVGVNIVQPEDWPVPLRDYRLHMAMFRFLSAKYPQVHRSLHAGELAFGLVPPAALKDHIALAIDAGAQRIGHGVDIAYEEDAAKTMARMAREGIAVEINLSSNDVILGVQGAAHPLRLYRAHGVPVVLSSDDQGVLRSDMTNEYVRAAREQAMDYLALKAAARASLEYAFLPGESLWAARRLGAMAPACAPSLASAGCKALLAGSDKARMQLALERQFARFEIDQLAEKAQTERL